MKPKAKQLYYCINSQLLNQLNSKSKKDVLLMQLDGQQWVCL